LGAVGFTARIPGMSSGSKTIVYGVFWCPDASGLLAVFLRLACSKGTATLNVSQQQDNGSAGMLELLNFISYVITLYTYVILAGVIMSWLVGFGVINGYNPTVQAIYRALNALTEPLLRPIRSIIPDLGAIDISPIVLLLACFFVQSVVLPNLAKLLL
jgi:YggT family protein